MGGILKIIPEWGNFIEILAEGGMGIDNIQRVQKELLFDSTKTYGLSNSDLIKMVKDCLINISTLDDYLWLIDRLTIEFNWNEL